MMAIVGAGAAGLSLGMMLKERGYDDFTIMEKSEAPGGLCRSTTIDGFTWDVGPHILGGIPEAVQWVKDSTGIEFVQGSTCNIGFDSGHYLHHPFRDEAVGKRYMRKMWKADPDELSFPALNAQPNRKPGGVSTFDYPKHGGYQSIIDSWVTQLDDKIAYNVDVADDCGYERVVWTAPQKVMRYNSLITVTLGYEGTAPPYTAIYLPGTTPFHRLSFPAAFSASNAPEGHFSVQGEISVDHEDTANMLSSVTYLPAMLEKLVEQMMSKAIPVMSHTQVHHNAYPVPIEAQERSHAPNFYPHGRTGAHVYKNLDGVVADSMALAEELTK